MNWISVKKAMPDEGEFVLVWGSHVMPWMSQVVESCFVDVEDGQQLLGITHWMPLPDPPEGKAAEPCHFCGKVKGNISICKDCYSYAINGGKEQP